MEGNRSWGWRASLVMTVCGLMLALVTGGALRAAESPGDLLAGPAVDLSSKKDREQVVGQMRTLLAERRQAALAEAARRGWTVRGAMPGGGWRELAEIDAAGRPRYFITHSANAAISAAAKPLWSAPYAVNGSGVVIGQWDGGSPRTTHQEFGGRVTVKDGATAIDHATHVGGIMIAAGVVASAHGMANGATIDAYDWTGDIAEMADRAAAYAGESGKIYLSNHSYGYSSGWVYAGAADHKWEWYGDGTTSTSIDGMFGRYDTHARESDALAYDAPYFLMFRSAGNDRQNNPATGDKVKLDPNSSTISDYDAAQHPAGDGHYRGGYDTVSFDAVGKNVITIGSVNDAVTSGERDVSKAVVSSFSSWGPTDDGRIKPDVVANGHVVYSATNGSDTSYAYYSGTSMSSPNAAGTAALLVERYADLFSGGAMRSATLKGLLIHTADDRGNPGPDYQYGWGLINAKAAADLLQAFHDAPARRSITEDKVDADTTTRSYEFRWDGVSPIKVTLCWTDPEGAATTSTDSRTVRLVNDLDLRLVAPDGTVFQPYVMPFVGTWTQESMSEAAVTGDNDTDNVEQVLISSPAQAGIYRAEVGFEGALANAKQELSLIVSGASEVGPPPSIASASPESGISGIISLTLSGSNFFEGAEVRLTRGGQTDVVATDVQAHGNTLDCKVDLSGMVPGAWDVTVTNPDGNSATLAGAFTITSALWSENFDGTISGWSASADTGTSYWTTTTARSQTSPTSYFASGPATVNTDNLISPEVAIPADAIGLRLLFWHRYDLQSDWDGGVLEFSIDGGAWFDVLDSSSGASFVSGGYTTTLNTSWWSWDRNQLAGRQAWSGDSGGWTRTVVELSDTAKYAGKNLRMRWRLGTDGSTASAGWYVDSIEISGSGGNEAPLVTTEAACDPSPVTSTATADLGVTASDDGGADNLTYTWSWTGPAGGSVSFSDNGTTTATATTATFNTPGDYTFIVEIHDAQGLTASSSVGVTVDSSAFGPSYANWQSEHFTQTQIDAGLADATADPDDDGFLNLLEYALGENPRVTSTGPLAELRTDSGGDERLALVFTRPAGLTDIEYTVEANDTPGDAGWQAVTQMDVTLDEATNTETVVAWDLVPSSGVARRFIRLRITKIE